MLVGEATHRAAEAAIGFEEAGAHEVKGKTEPLRLWRAVRVTAGRGGALRAAGLEPPFVGREREFRMAKELFHASAEEGKAHLLSVVGIAGIGKSRLAWEFEKYIDGLSEAVWWHRGRCLAYGDGVTYWALAEMVRMRARIADSDDAETALAKLRATVAEQVPDADERRWVEPRLAHLLGLEEGQAREPQDMYGAWRLFFERLSERQPVVMVFEDIQWADAGLLDFVEYLLEWSRAHRIFMLTLGRPELTDRRPGWGAGKRAFTALYLEPLPAAAMAALMAGLVPGLGDDLVKRILERAEGIPLYAVETVRMLLDRNLLVQDGDRYRPAGPIDALDIPETLHALIAARLDAVGGDERRVLQDAAVLGKTFTAAALAAVSGLPEPDLDAILWALVRKEFLQIQTDPASPERGQYGFLQDLVLRVAYDTLGRRDRKARHLAVAAYFATGGAFEDDEIVEVIASHYVSAYEADPGADDAGDLRAKARETLARAGERATSLAAFAEAQRYFEQAIGLGSPDQRQARLHERAGQAAAFRGASDAARAHFDAAIELFESHGETHSVGRATARLAEIDFATGRIAEATPRMKAALAVTVADGALDEDTGYLAHQLGRMEIMTGELDAGSDRVELALSIAETFALHDLFAQALQTKALALQSRGRPSEARVLLEHALVSASEVSSTSMRAHNNLAELLAEQDRFEESLAIAERGLELAQRVGDSLLGSFLLAGTLDRLVMTGRWEDALARFETIRTGDYWVDNGSLSVVELMLNRGDVAAVDEVMRGVGESPDLDTQTQALLHYTQALTLRVQGRPAEALVAARAALDRRSELGLNCVPVKRALVEAITAAIAAGELDQAEELLGIIEGLRPGELTPLLKAHGLRLRAQLDIRRNTADRTDERLDAAVDEFRQLGTPFWLAVRLLEHAEWSNGGRAPALVAEAQAIFESLGATPWLERLARLASPPPYATASSGGEM